MLHVDEQFYLLVGQRMIEGWAPYADIWDRKPVGLFLIYAAIRLLGGDGIVQYQLVATAFAAATAGVIYLLARRGTGTPAAVGAALIYGALLAPINGAGGQSPVFYNLLMAGAALLAVRAGEARDRAVWRHRGIAAMILAGLALQVKYTAVIEGAFFGLWLLWTGRRFGASWRVLRAYAALFAAVALTPTALAAAWFASIGAFDAFATANFLSIFQRTAPPAAFEQAALAHTVRMLALAAVLAAFALLAMWRRRQDDDRLFLSLWMVFAVAGFFAIGNYYDHYALPLLVPLAAILSRLFDRGIVGALAFAALFAQATLFGLLRYSPVGQAQATVAAMTAAIRPATLRGECLFVADTPLVLYLTTQACAPWRYAFPFHLLDATEAATGDSGQAGAMRAILASAPGAIVTGAPAFTPTVQQANVALLERILAARYTLVSRYPDRGRTYLVWLRSDLTERSSAGAQTAVVLGPP